MGKLLITGATGFIGSNLSRKLLAEGEEVHIIVRPGSNLDNIDDIKDSLKLFEYDGEDIDSLIEYFIKEKFEMVYHLASLFIAEHKPEQISALINSNVNFGTHLLEAMSKSGVKRMINTGTSWQHYHGDDYNPVCLYAATKEAFEKVMRFYIESSELKVITLELFDTYGENDRRGKLINLLSEKSKNKELLKMSAGQQYLDLVHIDDVLSAYIAASSYIDEAKSKHEKFAVSSGREIKLKDLLELYSDITGRTLNVDWGAREYRKREVMNLWRNFKTVPGWTAKISLEEGLAKF